MGLCILMCLAGCGRSHEEVNPSPDAQDGAQQVLQGEDAKQNVAKTNGPFTTDTSIEQVKNDPVFDGYGRLLFPVDDW